jgi:hypothetical protein
MPLDLTTYKLDEGAAMKVHVLTQSNREVSVAWRKQLLDGGLSDVQTLMKAIAEYAPEGTCLDVGSADGPQYFGLHKFYPKVQWTGCEISQAYIDLFADALKLEGVDETPPVISVQDYGDLSLIGDGSFDVVTARSVLSHYQFAHAVKIMDEMIRIARVAVVIKFYNLPEEIDVPAEKFDEGTGNLTDRAYLVNWTAADWAGYVADKKARVYGGRVYVIEK